MALVASLDVPQRLAELKAEAAREFTESGTIGGTAVCPGEITRRKWRGIPRTPRQTSLPIQC